MARRVIDRQTAGARRKDGKGNQKGNSKGNQKGKKHVSGLEHGESADVGAEPAPEADVGLFDDVGAIDGKVCTPAAASAVEEWVRFNLDTGAAQTAVPKDWVNDKVTVTGTFRLKMEAVHACTHPFPDAPAIKY